MSASSPPRPPGSRPSTPENPSPSEEELLAGSPVRWASLKATIVHPTAGLMAFRPWRFQTAMMRDRSRRRLVLKARQIGFSQTLALEALHGAITRPYDTTLIIS